MHQRPDNIRYRQPVKQMQEKPPEGSDLPETFYVDGSDGRKSLILLDKTKESGYNTNIYLYRKHMFFK